MHFIPDTDLSNRVAGLLCLLFRFVVREATVPHVCLHLYCDRHRSQRMWTTTGVWHSSTTAARVTAYAATIPAWEIYIYIYIHGSKSRPYRESFKEMSNHISFTPSTGDVVMGGGGGGGGGWQLNDKDSSYLQISIAYRFKRHYYGLWDRLTDTTLWYIVRCDVHGIT